MQVDLAPHAAVRAHGADDCVGVAHPLRGEALPGHHLEDRAGWADAHAFAAPGAARLVGVAVGADDNLGVLTALADVQDSHDLNVLARPHAARSEEHTSELQSPYDLVCRLLLEKKNKKYNTYIARSIQITQPSTTTQAHLQ